MLAPNTGKLPNGIVGAVAWAATKLAQGHRWDTAGGHSLSPCSLHTLSASSFELGRL